MTPKTLKAAALSILAVLSLGLVVTLGLINREEPKPPPQPPAQTQQVTTEISYKGVAGKNALQLLREEHAVETQKYEGMGEFVSRIDGVKPDDKHFWALYVNGKQSQVGAEAYQTAASDQITWKLETIK